MSFKDRAAYQKRQEVKLVRVRHAIGVWDGMTGGTLQSAVNKVPQSAKLVDIEEADNGDTILVFEEER